MIGVNSVQGTGKVRMRPGGSVKYGREEPVRRLPQHRSKSLKVSSSTEFNTGLPKKEKVTSLTFAVVFVCLEWRCFFFGIVVLLGSLWDVIADIISHAD